MQEDKKEHPAAVPAGGKQPSVCDRLQRAFHVRPAFRPLRRLTVRHQDGAAKPTDAGAGAAPAEPARKHGGPPVPAPPRPLTSSSPSPVSGAPAPTAPRAPRPAPVRLPAVTTPMSRKAATSSVPTGPPVPVPPPDVVTAGVSAADEKAEDKAPQTKGRNRVGFSVRKALSSK